MSYKNALFLPGAGGFPQVWPYFSGRAACPKSCSASARPNTPDGKRFLVAVNVPDPNAPPITVVLNWPLKQGGR
jgi:hypothetical protein